MVVVQPRMAEIGQRKKLRVIEFLHPAYPNGANVLLRLYAVDDDGIDFDFAHVACSIIANNAFENGRLTQRRARGDNYEYETVTRRLLKDESYYFCVGEDASYAYPIITRIDDWEFPHKIWDRSGAADIEMGPIATWTSLELRQGEGDTESLPVAASDPKMTVRMRDKKCRVTGHSEATEVAHLVPSACSSWFDRNNMSRYCSNPIPLGSRSTIDDDRNGILLRRDLHWLLDASRLVFAPKPQDNGQLSVFLVHVLQPGTATELLQLYHNLALQPLRCISTPLMFARSALSILRNTTTLPNGGGEQGRRVRVFDLVTFKYHVRDMTQRQIAAYRTQSRNTSPSKRSRVAEQEDAEFECSSDSDGEASWCSSERNTASESESNDEDAYCEPKRGRPRKRVCYAHFTREACLT